MELEQEVDKILAFLKQHEIDEEIDIVDVNKMSFLDSENWLVTSILNPEDAILSNVNGDMLSSTLFDQEAPDLVSLINSTYRSNEIEEHVFNDILESNKENSLGLLELEECSLQYPSLNEFQQDNDNFEDIKSTSLKTFEEMYKISENKMESSMTELRSTEPTKTNIELESSNSYSEILDRIRNKYSNSFKKLGNETMTLEEKADRNAYNFEKDLEDFKTNSFLDDNDLTYNLETVQHTNTISDNTDLCNLRKIQPSLNTTITKSNNVKTNIMNETFTQEFIESDVSEAYNKQLELLNDCTFQKSSKETLDVDFDPNSLCNEIERVLNKTTTFSSEESLNKGPVNKLKYTKKSFLKSARSNDDLDRQTFKENVKIARSNDSLNRMSPIGFIREKTVKSSENITRDFTVSPVQSLESEPVAPIRKKNLPNRSQTFRKKTSEVPQHFDKVPVVYSEQEVPEQFPVESHVSNIDTRTFRRPVKPSKSVKNDGIVTSSPVAPKSYLFEVPVSPIVKDVSQVRDSVLKPQNNIEVPSRIPTSNIPRPKARSKIPIPPGPSKFNRNK